MEQTIRVSCPDCGEVELPTYQLGLANDDTEYAFGCPDCRQIVRKAADSRLVELLVSVGVGHTYDPDAVDSNARQLGVEACGCPVEGPPLTVDDELEFGLALERATTVELWKELVP